MPSAVLVARFRRFYTDPSLWRGAHYRTRDRVIPFPLFWIYYRAMPAAHALERVQHARAVASGISLALSKPSSGIPESIKSELAEAYISTG